MATTLTVHTVTRAGSYFVDGAGGHDGAATSADASGNQWANTGQEFIALSNASGGSITVTLQCRATPDGLAVTNKTVVMAASDFVIIGPFPPGQYNDGSGLAKVTFSSATGLSIMAFKAVPT